MSIDRSQLGEKIRAATLRVALQSRALCLAHTDHRHRHRENESRATDSGDHGILAGAPHRAAELVLDEIPSRHGRAECAQRARGTPAPSPHQNRSGRRVDGHHVDWGGQACPHEPRRPRNALGVTMPSKDLERPTLANGHELTRHADGKLRDRDDH